MEELDSLLKEDRVFKPSSEFSRSARLQTFEDYKKLYQSAQQNPQNFWEKEAKDLHWFKPWKKVLTWDPPDAQWFIGGKTNISYNCLDRHLKTKAQKPAILWEGEPGDTKTFSFKELHEEVSRFSEVLKNLGFKKGDRVIIYMPMIPELAIAMLSCARIGLVHSVIFGGFSSSAIEDRLQDSKARLIITADGGYRRGKIVPLKDNVDQAIQKTPFVEKVIVYQRTKAPIKWNPLKDLWWHELMSKAKKGVDAIPLDSEDPLFILYTSGTTGKPKGVVHTTGGYIVGAHTTAKYIFDLKEEDIYWCTADIGWVTGHTYVVYGILSNGATTFMYEGAPDFPHKGRFWDIIDRYKITIFYTSPTAIRAFIQWGDDIPKKYRLSSLRLLGTVGEPINPQAWMWYHTLIGKEKCPIVDTWWQTETGTILISPIPGAIPTKPGSATLPFPGILADVVDQYGNPLPPNKGGFLVIKYPWPAMLRTIYGDHERYKKQYWSNFKGIYWTGDEARKDEDGYFWIMGRSDDVIKVSGHRLGSSEIESALVSHPSVAEAAVVAIPHEIKGQGIVAFVTLKGNILSSKELENELKQHVVTQIGALARPEHIRFAKQLPKTRSGKIMRRLLRQIASEGKVTGDTTTLEDISVVQTLSSQDEE
ncbi:MAG: acetate--CoA ligase [Deltaproteobacteria bacterium GWA2_38_16]|nr:MAG: acetate--CoA ligase [Deltaproteobacteria bacterium GWA2_38_16]OGQ03621.1 MAG: acetate--CoA ligase [Deltaproteobacteria bacterium RIFCSPHIGHO2_02_FULL_38_15]OGQ35035.1 MAG: acetate--CoA ligase [Deltaproteobacteria bacterium RIFCSPLOWO2_01_FULL_38_9]OGQ61316.1 MAG: acetate--CoA ligase [Deltaproteobacteria bacterium RIFCSPLOWO2_12_FULL_38_8]HBQ21133.1 acetate--CoA ligase [Deltaproteobacteria bacterium]